MFPLSSGASQRFLGVRPYSSSSAATDQLVSPGRDAQFFYQAGSLVANPFQGEGLQQNKDAGAIAAKLHSVRNGREEPDLMQRCGGSLDTRGMTCQQHVSNVVDFYDGDEVKLCYYQELLAEAKRLTGCDKAIVASHVSRRVDTPTPPKEEEKPGAPHSTKVRSGAFMVHGDFCNDLKEQLSTMLTMEKPCVVGIGGLELTEAQLRHGRVVVLNFWRPISRSPLLRAPLAICDATSMFDIDMHNYAHDPQPPPQNYTLPLPNVLTLATSSPRHRWYTFPGMTRDECAVFKTYDSIEKMPNNGVGVHSAFEDPTTPQDAAARESIEARVVCFFETNDLLEERFNHVDAEKAFEDLDINHDGVITKAEFEAKWQRGAEEATSHRPPMENCERIAFYKWLEESDGWDGPVGLTAKFTIPSEKSSIFKDIMRENIAGTRMEAGMIQYDLVSNFEPGAAGGGLEVFWLLERFKTRQDLLLHVESEHYRRCQERFLHDMGGHPLVQLGIYRIDPLEP